MKIVVANKSSSVGKTTLTVHLIHPRMDNPSIYAIEATNTTAKDFNLPIKAYDPTQYKEMLRDLFRDKDAILDIGGSKNFSDFYQKMIDAGTSHDEFDYFLVPVTPNEKAEKETLATIIEIRDAGVPDEKIRVIYNCVNRLKSFEVIPGVVSTFNLIAAKVPESDVYHSLAKLQLSLQKLITDPTTAKEYKARSAAEKGGSEKAANFFDLYYAKSMAPKVVESLDTAWAELRLES
jgi:hypothetical protein